MKLEFCKIHMFNEDVKVLLRKHLQKVVLLG